ncbi:MAG: tetratricopeptide repeat protein, partial [Terriglobales bacterium]
INHGLWKDATDRLETLTASQSGGTKDVAWLAFAQMFQGKCDDAGKTSDKAKLIFDARDAANLPPEEKGAKAGAAKDKPVSDKPPKKFAATPEEMNAVLAQALESICRTKYGEAQAQLNLVNKDLQGDCLFNFTQAAIAGKEGRSADAAAFTQKAVEAAPDFAWGYRTLAKIYQNKLHDLQRADDAYVAALEISPDYGELIDALIDMRVTANNYDGAVDAAMNAIAADPKASSNYYRLAQIYIKQWRLREALDRLDKAIALDPQNARYYRARATVKRMQGALNDAIADQQKAVELSKDKPFELVELAAMNIAAGNNNRAADNLQEALKLDPDNQEAHDKLVLLLTTEKRYDDLVAEYRRLVERRPKDSLAHLGLAEALVMAGKDQDAVPEFVACANLDPKNPEPHRQLGALRLKQKDFPGAVKEYTMALNIN